MRKQKQKSKVDVYEIDKLLNFKNLDTSYKLFWIKGILDEVELGNQKISYQKLARRMIVESWEYAVEKGVRLTRDDRMHRIIESLQEKWKIPDGLSKEERLEILEQFWDSQMEQIVEELYEDTPYRLFEPLYEKDLKGKKENAKNSWLEEKINTEGNLLYKVDAKGKQVEVSKEWYQALRSQKKVIEGIYRDNLAYLLHDAGLGKSIRYSLK